MCVMEIASSLHQMGIDYLYVRIIGAMNAMCLCTNEESYKIPEFRDDMNRDGEKILLVL